MRNCLIGAAAGCLVGLAAGALVTRDLPGVLFATGLLTALVLLFGAGWWAGWRASERHYDTTFEETLDLALRLRSAGDDMALWRAVTAALDDAGSVVGERP